MESRMQRLELDKKMEEAKHFSSAQPTTPRKQSVPKEMASLAPPSSTDFISRNKVKAMTMMPSNRDDMTSGAEGSSNRRGGAGAGPGMADKHDEYGRVPEYLEERKARWAEEESEKRRRMPDPNCPPGMCLMPDSERQNTLQVLQASKEEALNQLRRMPFVIETPSMRKKQEYLEGKLREIDNAVAIFSKDKVYVAK